MHIEDILIYPVKALRGGSHEDAQVEPWGLRGDRCWMVVDANGRFITQRDIGRMALIQAVNSGAGIILATRAGARIEVTRPDQAAETILVTLWKDTVPAQVADAAANGWASEALGVACRLVYLADKAARRINPAFASDRQSVSFADGFPVLLASSTSMADLNTRLPAPIIIGRFRPNLVVAGAAPWEEDEWRAVRIGAVIFDVVKPCDRCIVTTIDPETGEQPDRLEPLRTLGTFRRDVNGHVMFGQNLIPRRPGQIRVGDSVQVIERGTRNFALYAPEPAEA